jgi:hypothetical protein
VRAAFLSPRLWPKGARVSTDGDVLFDGLNVAMVWGPVFVSAFVPGRAMREASYLAAVYDDRSQTRALEAFAAARVARDVGGAGLGPLGAAALAAAGLPGYAP